MALIGLLALGCEGAAPATDAAPPPFAPLGAAPDAGDSAGALDVAPGVPEPRRFDLAHEVAVLADRSSVALPRGEVSDAYGRLREGASEQELQGLLHHSAPVMRALAFRALAERQPERSLFAELSWAMGDLAKVYSSDDRTKVTVAELALERAHPRLVGAERDAIEKRFLASGFPARLVADAKREWTFGAGAQDELRSLARGGDGDALLALARYRDLADVPVLIAALRTPSARQALEAIASFPHSRFVAPLQALQRELLRVRIDPGGAFGFSQLPQASWRNLDPNARLLCQLYAAALRFHTPVADAFLAAPWARGAGTADANAHMTCQRWVLTPELMRQHPAAGFRLWQREGRLVVEQLQALLAVDPARARRLIVECAPQLGRNSVDTAAWLLGQTEGADRAAALRGVRTGLQRVVGKELDTLAEVARQLQLRELLPELFARLERSRPLVDDDLVTFREEISRPLVWQLSRWQLTEAERQRLVAWVVGGRSARERDTKDPIGQQIVEEYLQGVLTRAGLLKAG